MCRREINDPLRECGHVSATQRPPAPFVINKRLKIKGKMPNGVSCELPAVLWALAMMRRGSSPGGRMVGSQSRKDRQEELCNAKTRWLKPELRLDFDPGSTRPFAATGGILVVFDDCSKPADEREEKTRQLKSLITVGRNGSHRGEKGKRGRAEIDGRKCC